MGSSADDVGYRKPPASTRFRKGQSGNPRGRPRNRRRELPYDAVLGQMVTIREEGRERRVTAAEAFLLHLTKRGLQGDSGAARASLAAIEAARSVGRRDDPITISIVVHYVTPGSVGPALDALGMAVKLNKSLKSARYQLRPWLVDAALKQLGERHLTAEEQRTVVKVTRSPEKVQWPDWWAVRD